MVPIFIVMFVPISYLNGRAKIINENMKIPSMMKNLIKDSSIKTIFRAMFREAYNGRMGMSISSLSEKTGIERHRLVGILEVLVVLGILVAFDIGMAKAFAPSPMLLKVKSLIRL